MNIPIIGHVEFEGVTLGVVIAFAVIGLLAVLRK